MARHKDADWNLSKPCGTWTEVQVAVMMDIRDELKEQNQLLGRVIGLLNTSRFCELRGAVKRIDKRLGKRIKLP